MYQEPSETVAEFSQGLLSVQHELSKHIPYTHLTKDGSDIELQYALLIRLRSEVNMNSYAASLNLNLFKKSLNVQKI